MQDHSEGFKLLSVQMAVFLNNSNNKTSSAPRMSADMVRVRSKFLPSIFEEKNDDKIQDFRKAFMLSEDDDEENGRLAKVRSAIHDAETADDNKPITPGRAITTAGFKAPIRRFSESRMEPSRSKRQGSAYAGGSRSNSCISLGQRSFGIGQRKITSPGVDRARQADAAVIDLTNPEGVKEIAQRLFQDELKLDMLKPRFDEPEDFLTRLRWKTESTFTYGELWQREMSAGGHNNLTIMMNNATINQRTTNDKLVQKNKHSKANSHSHTDYPFLQISYSRPTVLKTLDTTRFVEKKNLTTSYKPQADYGSTRTRDRILNQIRRYRKKDKHFEKRGQTQDEVRDFA